MKALITVSIIAFAFLSPITYAQILTEPGEKAVREANRDIIVDQAMIDHSIENHLSQPAKASDASVPSENESGTGLSTDGHSLNQVTCDDFDVANTTTISGWTEQSGDWQIFNNMLKTPGITGPWQYITLDGSFQDDGCITGRAIYGSPAQIKFVGLVARYVSPDSYILFKIQENSSLGYWNSYWIYVNGSIIRSVSGGNFGTDAIIQLEYSGIDVTVRIDVDRDGTFDYSDAVTVANISPGLCGVGAYNNAFLDDFCCGPTCDIPIVPLSNNVLYIAFILMVVFIAIRVYRMA